MSRHELQWIAQVAIARAEATWLEGPRDDAIAQTQVVYDATTSTWYETGRYWR